MGLLDGLTGSGEDTPMDLVEEAMEGDHTVGERTELYLEAIERSEEQNDGTSTCTLAHFSFAEMLVEYDASDAMDDPLGVAESHLRHCEELLQNGHEDEEMVETYVPNVKLLLAKVALQRENWGLVIDRTRQGLERGLDEEFVPDAMHVMGQAYEQLGNDTIAENYYQDAENRAES